MQLIQWVPSGAALGDLPTFLAMEHLGPVHSSLSVSGSVRVSGRVWVGAGSAGMSSSDSDSLVEGLSFGRRALMAVEWALMREEAMRCTHSVRMARAVRCCSGVGDDESVVGGEM